ncbi:MAG: glutamate 5-kinase [Methanophagales archaeon]|nr:glutamate 5-kinase [Methanophagales archaeon]
MDLAELAEAKRIVVKVGSSSLTDEHYRLEPRKVEKLVQEIVELRNRDYGKEVILVSSGAIGAGIGKLGLKQRPRDIKVLQATAAVGQSILMSTYDKYFSAYNQIIAQVLLTHSAFFNRQWYLNLRNTLVTLLKSGIIPVINENDTIAVDEIKLGDNDNLSALVACNLDADLLIILTNTDGLFTYDPRRSKRAELIPVVDEITPEIEHIAERTGSAGAGAGVGGMKTKIQAAKVTMKAGIPLIIANSSEERIIARIIDGERLGTLFKPKIMRKMRSKGQWILFASSPKGRIEVDEGAKTALIKNSGSLLPPGIVSVVDEFRSGDTVSIVDTCGVEFARGLSNYSSSDIEKLKGRQSREIEEILHRKDHSEIVYRGNLVLL